VRHSFATRMATTVERERQVFVVVVSNDNDENGTTR
jgi:hypothetical protein